MKKIGITCDDYKVDKFRKALLKEGFSFVYDGESGIKKVHLFQIEVRNEDYKKTVEKISKSVEKLELEFKHSN